ncbi:MAG TPA: STAS domain-containing protein [Bacteriovoracaceae bacterium]|nr:STAS domain-containing protein [Bacteriovoracaceae bacterium]
MVEENFDFKITTNKVVTVVTFQGRITKESVERLEKCRGDIGPMNSKLFIIYFKDVQCVEYSAYRELTLIQQEMRKKDSLLCIVGLNSELKALLTTKAIVRTSELKKTLEEAIRAA